MNFDVVLVGGGLANGLCALALRERRPDVRIALVERDADVGGNHTWCCFGDDLDSDTRRLVEPLVVRRWEAHDVVFPGFARTLDGAYLCVTAARLRAALTEVMAVPGSRLFTRAEARAVEPREVTLADGTRLRAPLVLDGRGPASNGTGCGWQKFLGCEVTLSLGSAPLPERPTVMDASVEQVDGYDFMYVLPLASDRALIEDTSFSDSRALEPERRRARVRAYAAARGWTIQAIEREETGVLPMPWTAESTPIDAEGVVRVGYRGGWFHAGTGYSLPIAAAVAHALAGGDDAATALTPLWRRVSGQNRFFRLLNRLTFRGVRPGARRDVYRRFYGLPAPLIRRFYAGATTWGDRLRILGGRPPAGLDLPRLLRTEEGP